MSQALSPQGIPNGVGRGLGMAHRCLAFQTLTASQRQDLSLSLNNGQAGLGISLKQS